MASFVLSFFPPDVLDEIWDLIESVSEGFPTYSCDAWNLCSISSWIQKLSRVLPSIVDVKNVYYITKYCGLVVHVHKYVPPKGSFLC